MASSSFRASSNDRLAMSLLTVGSLATGRLFQGSADGSTGLGRGWDSRFSRRFWRSYNPCVRIPHLLHGGLARSHIKTTPFALQAPASDGSFRSEEMNSHSPGENAYG